MMSQSAFVPSFLKVIQFMGLIEHLHKMKKFIFNKYRQHITLLLLTYKTKWLLSVIHNNLSTLKNILTNLCCKKMLTMARHIDLLILSQYYSFIWWSICLRTFKEKSKHLQTSSFVKLRLSGCDSLLVA